MYDVHYDVGAMHCIHCSCLREQTQNRRCVDTVIAKEHIAKGELAGRIGRAVQAPPVSKVYST